MSWTIHLRWDVCSAIKGSNDLSVLLENGWEPFAATVGPGDMTLIYLRKQVARQFDSASSRQSEEAEEA